MPRFLALAARLCSIALACVAATAPAQAGAERSGQFFRPLSPTLAAAAKSTNAPGVRTRALPVALNAGELLELGYLGEIELTLPSGVTHTAVRELIQDHGNGVSSWVGYLKGLGNRARVIVTTGPAGSYGVIDSPEGSFRLLPGGEHDWLVDMTKEQLYLPIPRLGNDAFEPPAHAKSAPFDPYRAAFEIAVPGRNSVGLGKATPTPQAVIDLMFVVTQGLSNKLGATLATRLAFLVTRANTSYADSEIAVTVRHVNTTVVNYTDDNDDGSALDAITPQSSGFDSAAFGNIETIRNSVGADLVAMLRNGDDFGGSGVAWLGSSSPSASFMYSVTTGCLKACESVFIHELGHNMGNAHDRSTVAWQAGGTSSYGGGAFPYSFGYAFCKSGALSCNPELPPTGGGCAADSQPECSTQDASNFGDIMAYFQGTADTIYKFSNPNVTCATPGGDSVQRPCGVSESQPRAANTALSMNNNRVALSALKPTMITGPVLTVTKAGTGSGTVNSSPAGISCGSTCSASFSDGATVTLTASATSGSVFAGWSGSCTGTSTCAVTMSAARSVTATFNVDPDFDAKVKTVVTSFYQTILGRAPDAGGLAFWSSEATRVVGLGADVKEVFYAMSMSFFSSAEYLAKNASDTQYITDLYKTFFVRDPSASELSFWLGELTAVQSRSALLNSFLFAQEFSNLMTSIFGATSVRPEVNMTMDLYRGTFGRLPDSAGFNGYLGIIRTAQCQGSSQVSTTLNSVLDSFFNSGEYAARARGNRDFMGDVYNAYMRRGPGGDTGGFNFWVGQLASRSRDQVRAEFIPSAEFQSRVTSIIAAGCFGG